MAKKGVNKPKLFGTDGIRGTFGEYPMNLEMAERIGAATGMHFRQARKTTVLIGRDTRHSGTALEKALIKGLNRAGANVILAGVVPTPAVAFLTTENECAAGIVISASHNHHTDNGIKFFDSNGFKLKDVEEKKLEKLILSDASAKEKSRRKVTNTKLRKAMKHYTEKVKSTVNHPLHGTKIVLDCANGAGSDPAPEVLTSLGAEVIVLNNHPNGSNINLNCGALHPNIISEYVQMYGAHIGIALDGDADRVIMVDEEGQEVCGDTIMAICAMHMNKNETLNKNTLVVTPYSNRALRVLMERNNCQVIEAKNGDRHVAAEMRKKKYNLGGEQSGHLIFMDHSTTGDGLLAACQVLNIMKERGKGLSDLSSVLRKFPQKTVSVPVREKTPFEKSTEIMQLLDTAQQAMGKMSRVVLRYSGTENRARVMVEGIDSDEVDYYADKISDAVRGFVGVQQEN